MRIAVALLAAIAAILPCESARAREFTVQLCQQRDRAFDGLGGQITTFGAADVSEHCGHLAQGLTLIPPGFGMAPGASASASLQAAGGGARIVRAILWHDSVVGGAGLQLSLESATDDQTRVLHTTAVGSGGLGGADQEPIGPTSTGLDFADAPVGRLDYVLRCLGPAACPGGAGAARLQLFGAELTFTDGAPPALAPVDWPSASVVRGTFAVAIGAQDAASGVRRVAVTVDGSELVASDETCDARMVRPCPERADRSLAMDTRLLTDGSHVFAVRLFDGAGNVMTSLSRTLSVSNRRDRESPPFNEQPPTIVIDGGAPRPGITLRATSGVWSPDGLRFRYSWSQCAAAGACQMVEGAQDSTYVLTNDDVGKRLAVTVRAFNEANDSGDPAGATTTPVQPAALRNRLAPDVSGSLAPGKRAIASPGEWDGPSPIKFSYRWLVCRAAQCKAAKDAAGAPTYDIRSADQSRSLVVEVTARAAGNSVKVRSAPVGPIRPARAIRRMLPKPSIDPVIVAKGVAGDSVYRLTRITVGALRRGSTVDLSCTGGCIDLAIQRRATGSRVAIRLKPAAQLLPGAKIVVKVRRAGFVGRIRRVILGRNDHLSLSKLRCLAAGSGKEISCG